MHPKMLLPHNNLHLWIPGPTAAKVLLLCTGPRAAAGWGGHWVEALLWSWRSQTLWFSACSFTLSKAFYRLITSREGCWKAQVCTLMYQPCNKGSPSYCPFLKFSGYSGCTLLFYGSEQYSVCLIVRTCIFTKLPRGQSHAYTPQAK